MKTIDFTTKRHAKLNEELDRELKRAAKMPPGTARDALLKKLEELAQDERHALGEVIGVNEFLKESGNN